VLCLHCTPDLDKLSAHFDPSLPAGGFDGSQGGTAAGGDGESGGTGEDGGTNATAGEGGQDSSSEAGEGGTSAGGKAGAGQGGRGGSGGTSGTGGSAGGGPLPACPGDGCVLLTIPASTATPPPKIGYQQFFTINLDLTAGVDLSDSVITARVRALDFNGTTETVQLYASALPNYNFWGSAGSVALSTLAAGGTLTMDLTNTGTGWDAKHAVSLGVLFKGGSSLALVKLLIEDIQATVKADPSATPKYGPWLFAKQTDVNENPVEQVPGTFATPNVIFPNPYQTVPTTQALWVAPSP